MKKIVATLKLTLFIGALILTLASAFPQDAEANPFPWCTGGPFLCEVDPTTGQYYWQYPDGY